MRDAFVRLDNEIVNGAFTTATSTGVGVASVPSAISSWLLGSSATIYPAAISSLRTALSGACAIVSYLDGEDIYVACTGDCRAVLGRRVEYSTNDRSEKTSTTVYTATPLSADQTARNPAEYARLSEEHPGEEVIIKGRILGGLMPTRAFGDSKYKWSLDTMENVMPHIAPGRKRLPPRNYKTPPYVTACPEVVHYTRSENDAFLVLATDGLWDDLSNETCAKIVGEYIEQSAVSPLTLNRAPKNAATELIRGTLGGTDSAQPDESRIQHILSIPNGQSRRYRDDITVNVIFFGGGERDSALVKHPATSGIRMRPVPHVELSQAAPKRANLGFWERFLQRLPPPITQSKL
eukprot:jgi/Hompol1/5877/HPOL_000176-RA